MSLRFSNGQTGVLTYSVNGVTVVKSIVRQVFGGPVNACAQGIPPQLLLGVGAPSATGSAPVMKIDLTTGAISNIGVDFNKSIGCKAGNLTTGNLVRIVCAIGPSYWDYNPMTNTSTQNTVLPKLPSSREVSVVSLASGLDAYGAGSPTTAQILFSQGNAFVGQAVDISTKATAYSSKLLLDPSKGAAGKLFSLNVNNAISTNPLSVDLIDIATRRVESSVTQDRIGVDMALYNNEVYVAMVRNTAGKDLVKYNSSALTKTGEGAMTGTTGTGAGQHLFSMAVDAAGVHVGTATGLQTLSHDFTRVLRTTSFPGGGGVSQVATSASGKLYVVILDGSGENVLELAPSTDEVLRKWRILGEPQSLSIVGN